MFAFILTASSPTRFNCAIPKTMTSCIRPLILFCLLISAHVAIAQELRWHSDIGLAQRQATGSGAHILIFFSGPSTTAAHYEKLFQEPAIQQQLQRYALARLDILSNRAYAQQLAVTQPGIILIYSASGQGIGRIETPLSADELVRKLAGGTSPVATPVVPTSPPVVAAIKRVPPLTTGERVSGPFELDVRKPSIANLGVLEADKWYIAVVEGQNNPWGDDGFRADAFFIFNRKKPPSTSLEPWDLLRFKDGDMPLAAYYREVTGVPLQYNNTHRYEVPISGTGKNVILYIWERQPSHYNDNTGAVKITLYSTRR